MIETLIGDSLGKFLSTKSVKFWVEKKIADMVILGVNLNKDEKKPVYIYTASYNFTKN